MPQPRSSSKVYLWFATFISTLGTISLPLLLLQPVKPQVDFSFGRSLVGLAYAGICILGITAVFYPKECQNNSLISMRGKPTRNNGNLDFPPRISTVGHHPNCEKFSVNRIQIRKNTLCASCAGLLVGAIIALAGTVLYFFLSTSFFPADPRILLVGTAGMLLGLVQIMFRGYVKLAVNTVFVLCSFITLVMVDLLAKNLLMDAYSLAIIVSLLLTRIALSQWNNQRVCSKCDRCSLLL